MIEKMDKKTSNTKAIFWDFKEHLAENVVLASIGTHGMRMRQTLLQTMRWKP